MIFFCKMAQCLCDYLQEGYSLYAVIIDVGNLECFNESYNSFTLQTHGFYVHTVTVIGIQLLFVIHCYKNLLPTS